MDLDIVALSRLQFAITALYHFLFVPLTLGLAVLLAIMETVYVMTGRTVWRDMTKFWGVLFGINFAMGVATGIVMEFQFGMNWSYFSHYSYCVTNLISNLSSCNEGSVPERLRVRGSGAGAMS